jgi:hypothetical protein
MFMQGRGVQKPVRDRKYTPSWLRGQNRPCGARKIAARASWSQAHRSPCSDSSPSYSHPRCVPNRFCDAHRAGGPFVGSTSLVIHLLPLFSCDLVKFSWPFMQTGRIQTGPHAQLRYGHFAAGERPGHEGSGVLALTFWASHPPLSQPLRSRARKTPSRRLSVLLKVCQLLHAAITFVHDAPSRLLIGAT